MTASDTIKPFVMSRLARMRSASTWRPRQEPRPCEKAPLARTKISGKAIHSISQGPVERHGPLPALPAGRPRAGGQPRCTQRCNARDGIALLRHRAARTAAVLEGFKYFSDLGLHHQFDVRRDFPRVPVTRPRKHPASATRSRAVCQAISGWPSPTPATARPALRTRASPSDASVPPRRRIRRPERVDGVREAQPMALECGQKYRHLEAEGDRDCLLQIAAARHRRIAVALGESGEGFADRIQVVFDQRQALRGSA